MRLRLTSEEKERLTKRYTNDSTAYQSYLQGRFCRNKTSPEGLRRGIEYLDQAVAKDPRFALAYDERSNRLAYLGREPVWADLRSDPRFAALLARIGLPNSGDGSQEGWR